MIQDDGLAPRKVMAGLDIAGVFSLLQQLLHHAQRDAEALCDRLAGVFPLIVTGKYPLPDIEG